MDNFDSKRKLQDDENIRPDENEINSKKHISSEPSKRTGGVRFIDKVGTGLDTVISRMEKIGSDATDRLEDLASKTEETAKSVVKTTFELALIRAGIDPKCIQALKSMIISVSPRKLVDMDSALGKTEEKTRTKGGREDGKE